MKTITLKADNEFNAILSQLATRLHTSRSAVIRDAVRNYSKQLDKDVLRQNILSASRKTRKQAIEISKNLEAADNDGL